ncbi:hypothetical protein AGLY_010571 [Aphis glycines]|uniref:Uncharacterized protein n=1 Tax=Aphis glycines TaxID=307491 RepID=A0A6G0TE46_APHGL|nr:hypothetical protein AGLY_010571 [Aphis glycines]
MFLSQILVFTIYIVYRYPLSILYSYNKRTVASRYTIASVERDGLRGIGIVYLVCDRKSPITLISSTEFKIYSTIKRGIKQDHQSLKFISLNGPPLAYLRRQNSETEIHFKLTTDVNYKLSQHHGLLKPNYLNNHCHLISHIIFHMIADNLQIAVGYTLTASCGLENSSEIKPQNTEFVRIIKKFDIKILIILIEFVSNNNYKKTINFTTIGSQTFKSLISAISPVSPFIPQLSLPLTACLALKDVIVLIVLTPQFCKTISIEPPPDTNFGFSIIFLATCKASCKLRSTSFNMSLLGPLSKIVQAFGLTHSVMKWHYKLLQHDYCQIFSNVSILIYLPLTRNVELNQKLPFLYKPSLVSALLYQNIFVVYILLQFVIIVIILGFFINLLIFGCVTSLFNIIPFNTWESSIAPPGTFSTLAYLFISISVRPSSLILTVLTAFKAILHAKSDQRPMNLVPTQDLITSINFGSSSNDNGILYSLSKKFNMSSKA